MCVYVCIHVYTQLWCNFAPIAHYYSSDSWSQHCCSSVNCVTICPEIRRRQENWRRWGFERTYNLYKLYTQRCEYLTLIFKKNMNWMAMIWLVYLLLILGRQNAHTFQPMCYCIGEFYFQSAVKICYSCLSTAVAACLSFEWMHSVYFESVRICVNVCVRFTWNMSERAHAKNELSCSKHSDAKNNLKIVGVLSICE